MARYDFREVTKRDLALLRVWASQPHWQEWWGSAEEAVDEIEEAMDSIETEPLIVELDGKPVAYLQAYDPHMEDEHPYQDQPFGTLGLDLTLGPAELIGQGHGSTLLKQFAEQLFGEGHTRLIIDPDPTNVRAIRAFEKAGFTRFDQRNSIYGSVLLMARDAEKEI